MLNSRYVKPYFSSLKLVLFPGVTQVAVQDREGRQGTQLVDEAPQIKTTITGWINNQVVRQDVFVFQNEPVDTPSMTDVLDQAKSLGVDVAEAWNNAFDQVAEIFPSTQDQPSGSEASGPAVYLRPDAFEANLHPTTTKSITIKVGVYSDAEYSKLQTYLNLHFEDGETKREREANLAQLDKAKSDLETNLPHMQALLAARLAGEPVPKSDGVTYNELGYRVKQIAELSQVLNGDLSLLLGSKTKLQQLVMASVGALCTAILLTLKATHPDYADIDVQKIMTEFAVPDIT
jgi:hypothetical protein